MEGPGRHQARLILTVLTLMAAYFAVIGLINVLVFGEFALAAIDFGGMLASLLVLAHFWRSADLARAGWGAVLVLCATLLLFIHAADGRSYSILWITVLPPVAFFLLGYRAGAWICGLMFIYVATFFYLRMPEMAPAEVGLGSLLNIVEVFIAHWILFRLYERSRAETLDELERLSETDKLTGLYNRSRLDDELQQQFVTKPDGRSSLTLVLADIDHFKSVNDQYGHLTGDRILQAVATVLRSNIRSDDRCGRWGGEEFLIICPDTDPSTAKGIITRLQKALSEVKETHGIAVSLSFGVATLNDQESIDDLLRRADNALYEAKRQGRNRVVMAAQPSIAGI